MSQEQAWILEEMARTIQAERLAAAEQYRLVTAVPGSFTSPRTILANALRSLAALVDEKPVAKPTPKPEPRLVRAF
jgi:hypothetical protein